MPAEISKNIYYTGAQDFDRRLFDELIPLPEGTSYNSYLIKGSEKTALIDAVDPTKREILFKHLDEINTPVDYVVCNHAEQDHAGAIPDVLSKYPAAKVVTNAKCKEMLMTHLHIPEEKFIVIKEGEEISLGDKTLQFFLAPWVHWPETMFTWLKEDRILFPCDFLGSHLASSEIFFNPNLASEILRGAKRYYAEIMMPFRHLIPKYIELVESLKPALIAPSHGPVYREPSVILNAYKDWVSDRCKPEVILAFVSMHDSTRIMADHLLHALASRKIKVHYFNLTKTDIGELAIHLVDSAVLLLGTPTVLTGPHPAAMNAAYLVNALRPKLKYIGVFGSYGWGGKTVERLKETLNNLKADLLQPVMVKGKPDSAGLKLLENMADEIQIKLKEFSHL